MAGKYQAYPEYKESNWSWLREIPVHWITLPLKRVCDLSTGLTPPTENEFNYVNDDLGQPWVRPEDLKEAGENTHASKFLSQSGWKLMRVVPKNSTLICCIGTIGKAGFVTSDVSTNQQITSASFHYSPRFNYYLIQAAREVLEETATGNVIQILNSERLGRIAFLSIHNYEADKIANFLDHETAKIDTLIEKQQQLIKLLKEKRQAVISHAVTKGLNPNAPMRDSGVDGLGEAPAHWKVKRFKYIFKIRKRISGELGYEVLSITQKGIKVKDIESGDGQLSMDYSKYQLVYKGDYAMNHMDLLTGFVDISKYDGVTSPDYRVFTLEEENAIPEYFLAFLQMGYINKLFFPFGQGAAQIGRWRLPTDAFNEFLAPCPPEHEQKEISEFIIKNLDQMALLEEKAITAIKLMQERRTALISAAVTGKIDVRNWKAQHL